MKIAAAGEICVACGDGLPQRMEYMLLRIHIYICMHGMHAYNIICMPHPMRTSTPHPTGGEGGTRPWVGPYCNGSYGHLSSPPDRGGHRHRWGRGGPGLDGSYIDRHTYIYIHDYIYIHELGIGAHRGWY